MFLLKMYLTMLPLILGGVANMVFTKTKLYKKFKKPIDKGRVLRDGERLFGDNKTSIGFVSMIFFCTIFCILNGLLCDVLNITQYNELYLKFDNTVVFNLFFGVVIGFIYMVFELPNSYAKRRQGIPPGKTIKGVKGLLFFIVDQIDSLIGVMFVLFVLSGISFWKYLLYIFVGAITHILINLILYLLKVRKNI